MLFKIATTVPLSGSGCERGIAGKSAGLRSRSAMALGIKALMKGRRRDG